MAKPNTDDAAILLQDAEHRARAREDLLDLVTYCWPGYIVNWHHRLLADKLTLFAQGKIPRLLICVPPQTGKSTLISRFLPAFILGRNPDDHVLCASNAADTATRFSREAQRVMLTPEYKSIFPDARFGRLDGEERRGRSVSSARQWELIGPDGPRGGLKAIGRGATSAGIPAKWALVDDPFRGSEDAASPTIRKKAWTWFLDDIMNRIGSGGSVCVTHTAWHGQDIRGKIKELNDTGVEEWEVVELPARLDDTTTAHPLDPRKQGDPLWTWFYSGKERGKDLTDAQRHKKAQEFLKTWEAKSAYGFASLGQQKPTPAGGAMLPISKIKIVTGVTAERIGTVRYWDNAGTEGAGDWTVGFKLSALDNGQFLIEHVVRIQEEDLERERIKKQTAVRDGHSVEIHFEQEPGSGGKDQAKATARMLAGYIAYADRVTGSKIDRCRPFAAQVQAGNVLMLEAPWNKALLDEFEYWPNGLTKDQGDAAGGAFAKLTDDDGYSLEGMATP